MPTVQCWEGGEDGNEQSQIARDNKFWGKGMWNEDRKNHVYRLESFWVRLPSGHTHRGISLREHGNQEDQWWLRVVMQMVNEGQKELDIYFFNLLF